MVVIVNKIFNTINAIIINMANFYNEGETPEVETPEVETTETTAE